MIYQNPQSAMRAALFNELNCRGCWHYYHTSVYKLPAVCDVQTFYTPTHPHHSCPAFSYINDGDPMSKKLFQLNDVRTRKPLPSETFDCKTAAKTRRRELNTDGEFKYYVAPGPDHRLRSK